MIKDLIRAWGVRKFLESVISVLENMGINERELARDLAKSLEKYLSKT